MYKSHKVLKNNIFNRSKKTRLVTGQRSLLGVLCKLMEGQKLVVSVVRVEDSNGDVKIIPFGYKIKKESIPSGIREDRVHTRNLITITVDGCNPLNAMLVSVGGKFNSILEKKIL